MLAEGAADQVVVVDNGSSDDSVAVLRRDLPDVTVIAREHNGGFAAGANTGMRHADADVVVLLNNDAVPAPGFVAALRDHLAQAGPEVAAVTGRIVLAGRWTGLPTGVTPAPDQRVLRDHDGRPWTPSADGEVRLNSTGVLVDRDGNGMDRDWFAPVDRVADVDVFGFSGGASALRRSALDDVGLLDESLFMYYEDTELAWRLRRRGWRVEHAAGAVVEHDHSASSGVQSDLFLFRNARNRMVVALWHAPWPTVLRDHDGRPWTPSADGEVRLNSTGVRVDRDGNGMDRDWFAPVDRVADVDVFGFSGGASALRRSALDDVGLLDESLFMYYEDTELAWRLRRRGWRVEHAAAAVVEHDHSASSGVQSDLFLFRNARNRMVVALWHAPWATVLRASARTLFRGLRGLRSASTRREARLVLAAFADVVGALPSHLARRLRESRRASVPRRSVDPGA